MITREEFLRTLFDADERVCFSENIYGIAACALTEHLPFDLFFSINPLKNNRADKNVAAHRNFLLEFDSIPLQEQEMMMQKSGLPVSAIVYSGGKSYHYYISLQEPVDAAAYANIAKRLHILVPEADPACKNPSRLARLPGAIRPDTGNLQECKYVGTRIVNDELLKLLPPLPIEKPKNNSPEFLSERLLRAVNYPNTAMQDLGLARNGFFHWLGQRMIDARLDKNVRYANVETAYCLLTNKDDFSLREALIAARVK